MEYHCGYCMCPKEIWKPSLRTYHGDECQLYDSFCSLLEDWMLPEDLANIATEELPKEFTDILDIEATVKELVGIIIECGVLTT